MLYNFGLVLSGGGTRGATHIGVIKALQEANLEADIIAGCSAGSLVGAFYAAGYPADDIFHFFKNTSLFSHPSFTIHNPGLFDSIKYIKNLKPWFPKDDFASLEKKLLIYSTDLIEGKLVEHANDELLKCIMASCAIPGIFTPVELKGMLLSDGGIINVFPVSRIRPKVKKILGVIITAPGSKEKSQLKNTYHVLDRAFTLNIYSKSEHEMALCDWLIDPQEIGSFNMISKKHLEDMYEIGYNYAKKVIPEITENLALIK